MIETSSAHDSDDCIEGCTHPDHDLEGEVIDLGFWLEERAPRGLEQLCWGMGRYEDDLEFVSL